MADFEENVRQYLEGADGSEGRKPDARYSSFDYCFNYFQGFRERNEIEALAQPEQMQLSCLHLGFYLASWGMLRGSSELLQKSARHLTRIVSEVAHADRRLWEIDADSYTEPNIQLLLNQAEKLQQAHAGMSDILATKIMLGAFGNVPAFDTNFKKGFGVATFGPKALRKVGSFYQQNGSAVERYRVPTLDFLSGEPTQRSYTRAKVIDMAFFIEGMPRKGPHNNSVQPTARSARGG